MGNKKSKPEEIRNPEPQTSLPKSITDSLKRQLGNETLTLSCISQDYIFIITEKLELEGFDVNETGSTLYLTINCKDHETVRNYRDYLEKEFYNKISLAADRMMFGFNEVLKRHMLKYGDDWKLYEMLFTVHTKPMPSYILSRFTQKVQDTYSLKVREVYKEDGFTYVLFYFDQTINQQKIQYI